MNDVTVLEYTHRTVLLDEAIDALEIRDARRDGIFVDGTFGRGGHSKKILGQLSAQGRLLAFDKDTQAVAVAEQFAAGDQRFSIVHDSFATMEEALSSASRWRVDGSGFVVTAGRSGGARIQFSR